jgi:hypothetical protein
MTQNLCHGAFAHIVCMLDYYSELVQYLQHINLYISADVPFLSHDHP